MARTITVKQFEELYRRTAPELFAYVRRRTWADPEDVVAEVFAVAWRRRADLPAVVLRRAWLYGAARRILLAQARALGREREAAELVAHVGRDVPAGETGSVEVVVAGALERLRPSERELLQLVEWEGMTPAEAAVVLGLRPGTVRVRLHRARQSLAADPAVRELVDEAPAGPGPSPAAPTEGRIRPDRPRARCGDAPA